MTTAIIVAGGSGLRFGSELPKQYTEVCGKPVIVHTLLTFNFHIGIERIIIGCRDVNIPLMREYAAKWGIEKVQKIIPGGKCRQQTVFNCLTQANCADGDIVLIHDAVRPLVTDFIIEENIRLAREYGAVNTCLKTVDTLARSAGGETVDEIPPRSEFYQVQTPQAFKYEIIKNAHIKALEKGITDATDDCALVMENGAEVRIAQGSAINFKITSPQDLMLFEALYKKYYNLS
ncbi:MAG: 2-C-methyl-D-erythritol 4-phosphate cytidylyltransferase [Clostridiales bacterium]|jgi:2-C-methyl-D-erythritol 4-phosphate cytidylyltransferase|nr:2-C-methyl-D-erythritol 4-phosphate cytidylyltransferase [Clostridiales bacterium]